MSWYESILVPLKENGVVERVMIVARDISERRAMLASLAEKEEVPGVLASESRLCQVFINILVNAAQAMQDLPHEEREISVRTHHDARADIVAIEVRDTGVGIAKERIGHVFEPFYTTKPTGTGLGLAISRDIVERMGGAIRIESEAGRGTTVTVALSTTLTSADRPREPRPTPPS